MVTFAVIMLCVKKGAKSLKKHCLFYCNNVVCKKGGQKLKKTFFVLQ